MKKLSEINPMMYMYKYFTSGQPDVKTETLAAASRLFDTITDSVDKLKKDFAVGDDPNLLSLKKHIKSWEEMEEVIVEKLVPIYADAIALPRPAREIFTMLLLTLMMPKDVYMKHVDLDELKKKADDLVKRDGTYEQFKKLTDAGLPPTEALRQVKSQDSSMEDLIARARKSINNNN